MAKLKIRVEGVDSMLRDFKRDFHRGLEESADELTDVAIDKSREVIQQNDAIFNREVYHNFRHAEVHNSPYRVTNKVYNTAAHAGALDKGVPAAEYADGGPPVQALLPWVARKMRGWSFDADGGDGGGGSSTTTISVQGRDETLSAEIPDTWNQYDNFVQPERSEMFIGQDIIVAKRFDDEVLEGTVVEQKVNTSGSNTDIVRVDFEDGSSMDLQPNNTNATDIFLGIESLHNKPDEVVYDAAENYIKNAETEHQPEVQEHFADVIRRKYAPRFRDNELMYDVVTGMTETTVYDGDAAASANGYTRSNTHYKINLRPQNGERTIHHEFTHGTHLSQGWHRSEYVEFPGRVDNEVYPDFQFNRDGSSNNQIAHMSESLLSDPPGYAPGSDRMEEVYDIVHGDYGITYDTDLDFEQLLDPDNDFLDAGDVIKFRINTDDGEDDIVREVVINDPNPSETAMRDSDYLTYDASYLDGSNGPFSVDSDGSPHNENVEILGAAKQPSINAIELEEDEPFERMIEAMNLGWMKSAFTISKIRDETGTRPTSLNYEVPMTWQAYSTRNPNEMLTTLTSLMWTDSPKAIKINGEYTYPGSEQLVELDKQMPGLIEAWLEVMKPSETVEDKLDDLGIDY